MIVIILLIGQASANVTIDSDKVFNVSGVRTFPVMMSNICSYYWDSGTTGTEHNLGTCNQSMTNLSNFKFSWIQVDISSQTTDAQRWINETSDNATTHKMYWSAHAGLYNNGSFLPHMNDTYFGGFYNNYEEPTTAAGYNTSENRYNAVKAAFPNELVSINHFNYAAPSGSNATNLSALGDILFYDEYTQKTGSTGSDCGITDYWQKSDCTLNYWHKDDFIIARDHYFNSKFGTNISTLPKPVGFLIETFGDDWVESNKDWYTSNKQKTRALTYYSIIVGAKAVRYWGNKIIKDHNIGTNTTHGIAVNSSLTTDINNLAGELTSAEIQNIILLPTLNSSYAGSVAWDNKVNFSNNPQKTLPNLTATTFDSFAYSFKQNGSKYYLIAVNKVNSELSETINISGLSGNMIATMLGTESSGSATAGRTIAVTNGVFNDTFDSYAVHIYEISNGIMFIDPTPANNSINTTGSITINTSVACSGNCTSWLNWNLSNVLDMRFNSGTGEDSSSYKNNGTIYNGTAVNSSGMFGSAMSFDGIDDNITIPDSQSMRMTNGGTVSAWIYPYTVGETAGRILDKGINKSAGEGYSFMVASSRRVQFNINAQGVTNSSVDAITYNTWNHVVFTFNASGRRIYVNGINVTGIGADLGYLPPDIAGDVSIGNRANASDRTFNGTIDDVRVWNRVLSNDEINASYNTSANRLFATFSNLTDDSYNATAYIQDSTGAVASTETRYWSVYTAGYIPSTPINLTQTNGSYWVNYSWKPNHIGNITDSFNVSVNGIWNNGSLNTYNLTYTNPAAWVNISVYSWNNTSPGQLNQTVTSMNTQVKGSEGFINPSVAVGAAALGTAIGIAIHSIYRRRGRLFIFTL